MTDRLTDEQRTLIEQNYGLVIGYCKLHGIHDEELVAELRFALCRSVMKWKPGKGAALSTYVYQYFFFTQKKYEHKMRTEEYRYKNPMQIGDPSTEFMGHLDMVDPEDSHDYIAEREELVDLRSALLTLPTKMRLKTTLFLLGYTPTEICRMLGLSKVCNQLNNGCTRVRSYLIDKKERMINDK